MSEFLIFLSRRAESCEWSTLLLRIRVGKLVRAGGGEAEEGGGSWSRTGAEAVEVETEVVVAARAIYPHYQRTCRVTE